MSTKTPKNPLFNKPPMFKKLPLFKTMPIITTLKATSYLKAFIVNSLISCIITISAITIQPKIQSFFTRMFKELIDNIEIVNDDIETKLNPKSHTSNTSEEEEEEEEEEEPKGTAMGGVIIHFLKRNVGTITIISTFISTFLIAMITFIIFHVTLGFGDSMISS